ncbi:Cysteine-rich secretory protein family [Geoglobus ahangari]|uniref:Cysteine-rich secretory protein family n=1 Tax=Geoglobus ahangari TaxID=113653 RepID=A0A0F7IG87_9EURY|nr:CAP domain-containing protein [Geoglobus ahangari]AKG91873.1 Cysteine-rich secretory protein family [Geoglobus ahangari]
MRICFRVRENGNPLRGYVLSGGRKFYVDGCADIPEKFLKSGFVFVGEYLGHEFEYRFDEPFSEVLISEGELLYDTSSLDLKLIEQLVFSGINRFREEKGLESIRWSERLAKIAREKSALLEKEFSHNAGGKNAYRLLRERGIYFVAVGENIYRIAGLKSSVGEEAIAERCVEGWKRSRGHRKVMLSEFTHCGVGVYARQKDVYITLIATLNRVVVESKFTKGQTLLLQPVDEEFDGKARIAVRAHPDRCFSLTYPEYAGREDFVEVRVLESCRGRVVIEYLDV